MHMMICGRLWDESSWTRVVVIGEDALNRREAYARGSPVAPGENPGVILARACRGLWTC
jgi:hypothetical protein